MTYDKKCYDCPRACGAVRASAPGYCGGGDGVSIAKTVDPFFYEEPCLGQLSAVFFCGCSLKCTYCQNHKISRGGGGKKYSEEETAALIDSLTDGNAVDLVTPTHYLSALERVFSLTKKRRRVIYNTSGYETADGVRRAAAFTDVFLTDFKYSDARLAGLYSSAPDYPDAAINALKLMRGTKDEWADIDGERVLTRGVIVRHLVLPGHADNSLRALDMIADAIGSDVIISLMSQFTPNGVGEPHSRLKKIEYKLVCEHAIKLGFTNGYFQDFDSADGRYTPEFN